MPTNRRIKDIVIAKVLRTLADKIEAGDVLPRGVIVTEDFLELHFEELHRLGDGH